MPRLTASPRSSSEHLRFSNQWRTSPPTMMAEVVRRGRYSPTATGITGMPRISITTAMAAPERIMFQGRFPFITPSTTVFMIMA